MFLLKFIFYTFLFLFILGLVVSFFLKRALRKMAKNMTKNFQGSENPFGNPAAEKKQTRPEKSETLKDKGEYVDFEEIKE